MSATTTALAATDRVRYGLILSGELPPPHVVADFEEVSLVRGEYVLRRSGHYIASPDGYRALAGYLSELCAVFAPKPVWYRLSDFESREISTLTGADAIVDEENPILGARGTRRALLYPQAFLQEARCVAEVRAQHPNLRFLPSYLGAADEWHTLSALLAEAGIAPPDGCMVETPAALHTAAQLRGAGAHRLVVGLNDLASLVLGAHRGGPFHDRRHPLMDAAVAGLASLPDGSVVAANAESPEHAARLAELGADLVAVHYSDLPAWFGERYQVLPDLDVVPAVKERTAALLAAR